MNVDLPAPFGPSNPMHCPEWTAKLSASSATRSPKRFETSRARTGTVLVEFEIMASATLPTTTRFNQTRKPQQPWMAAKAIAAESAVYLLSSAFGFESAALQLLISRPALRESAIT
jgi:hypothetical protein